MCECRMICLLMAILIAMDSFATALIAPTSEVNAICNTTNETLIAHPAHCAQYYNCSAPGMRPYRFLEEKNLQECPPPQLYNPDTQRCEHYTMVTCGIRTEPLGRCEYFATGRSPCSYYHPSCRNFPDGLNVYRERENTPFYIVCVSQRLVYIGQCPKVGIGMPFFNAHLRICSSY